MPRKLVKLVLLLVGIVIVIALCFVVFNANQPPPVVPLPNPNGYDDFVKAGQLVTGDASDFKKMTRDELAGLVAPNQQALKLLRTGLSRECRVPVVYLSGQEIKMLKELSSMKETVMVLCAEGRLAELEWRTNDAARIYLDGVRYGQESCRGGLLIYRLVGMACEAVAAASLRSLTNSLDAKESREIAQSLESIDARAEPFAETLAHEDAWSRIHSGFNERIAHIFMYRAEKQSRDRAAARDQAWTLQRRTMLVAFAARAYEQEKGKPPQTIADLVPEYLKAVPKDPVTGTNLSLGR